MKTAPKFKAKSVQPRAEATAERKKSEKTKSKNRQQLSPSLVTLRHLNIMQKPGKTEDLWLVMELLQSSLTRRMTDKVLFADNGGFLFAEGKSGPS